MIEVEQAEALKLAKYSHLSYEEGAQIVALLKLSNSANAISKGLGRSQSTIWRAIEVNSGDDGYLYNHADEKSQERLSE